MNKVLITIVTWNNINEISDCLGPFSDTHLRESIRIIVIDNASLDGTPELIKKNYKWVTLIENKENEGFAKAVNQAFDVRIGNYLMLLNPDTVADSSAIFDMMAYLQRHPVAGAVGPRLVDLGGKVERSCLPYPSLVNYLFNRVKDQAYTPTDNVNSTRVKALSGAALMVRSNILESVGPLDTDFFLYAEDQDWCYRICDAGWEIHYLPFIEIIHHDDRSGSQTPVKTLVRHRLSYLKFIEKHKSSFEARLTDLIFRAHLLFRSRFSSKKKRKLYSNALTFYLSEIRDSSI